MYSVIVVVLVVLSFLLSQWRINTLIVKKNDQLTRGEERWYAMFEGGVVICCLFPAIIFLSGWLGKQQSYTEHR